MSNDKTLATGDASYTTGHCAHNNRPGGCQLHNLQCGYPACDRRPAKPSLATAKHGGCVQLGDSARVTMSEDEFANLVEGEAGEHGEMLEDGGPYNGWCFSCEELIEFSRGIINAWAMERYGRRDNLCGQLQQKCSDWGTYWRAPDAHGVILNEEQALELLRDALGVEVDFSSAQPSPGGQGDELDLDRVLSLADVHAEESREDGVRLLDRGGLLAFAQDVASALAAHPPVRIYGCCAQPEGELHTAECPNMRHLAARQPVGEPVAWRYRAQGDKTKWYYSDSESLLGLYQPLYAAPPAQAVDLGQFRAQVAELLRSEFDLEVADPEDHRHDDGAGEADRIASKIAALLDSQGAR